VLTLCLALVHAGPARAAEIVPVRLETVPAVARFPVTLDGVTRLTDGDGVAHFTDAVASEDDITRRITLTENIMEVNGRAARVRLDRVYDSQTAPMLALDVSWRVGFRFSRPDGEPVDPSTVGDVTLKGETGEIVKVAARDEAWLQANRVIRRTAGPQIKPLRWSVMSVEFEGSNVVNAGQQRFYPTDVETVDLQLLFFGLDVAVRDGLYGRTAGDAVELVYPDGGVRTFPLDGSGRMTAAALPRGTYSLTILGEGPRMARPLAVSRNQSVDLDFYTWLDVATVGVAALTLALGLALAGRLRRRRNAQNSAPSRRSLRRESRRVRRGRGVAEA